MVTRDQIIAVADTWLGTPWIHQASCKGAGTDCIGFVAGVTAECGVKEAIEFLSTPEYRRYGRNPLADFMFTMCDKLMDRIPIHTAQPADVLMFTQGKHPMHFAFMLPNNRMIHAWAVGRKVVKHQLNLQWRQKIIRAYKIRGIE